MIVKIMYNMDKIIVEAFLSVTGIASLLGLTLAYLEAFWSKN